MSTHTAKTWLKKTLGLTNASPITNSDSHPSTSTTSSNTSISQPTSTTTTTTTTSNDPSNTYPSPLPTPSIRKPQHAARDARMSIPVNERLAHREMLARFEARGRAAESVCPNEEWDPSKGKGKGKERAVEQRGDSGNASATNRFSPSSSSASASASATAPAQASASASSYNVDNFASYAYVSFQLASVNCEAGEGSSEKSQHQLRTSLEGTVAKAKVEEEGR